MTPKHSIDFCPICGGGLCGFRICGDGPDSNTPRHGLIVCDECEALWMKPDLSTDHQYAELPESPCPVCGQPIWGPTGHWADREEIGRLGWESAIDPTLDAPEDSSASGEAIL